MENHRTRMMMTYVKAFGGMGSGEEVTPQDVWYIPHLDDADTIRPITTAAEAMDLIQNMINGTY